MRIRYGPSWNRMPSGNLNPAMKKQVQYYEEKLKQAKSTDEKMIYAFENKKEIIGLLDCERTELISRMPKSSIEPGRMSPSAQKLTDTITLLNEYKKECVGIAENMMKTLESDSVTNEMFTIHQKIKDKKSVFEELKQKYVTMQSNLQQKAKQRSELFGQIEHTMGEFSREKASAPVDAPRVSFFQALDEAVKIFNECHTNLQQGSHFHSLFITHISKLNQAINDFIMSRTMEKNEIVSLMPGMNMGVIGNTGTSAPQPTGFAVPQGYTQTNPVFQPPSGSAGGAVGYGAAPVGNGVAPRSAGAYGAPPHYGAPTGYGAAPRYGAPPSGYPGYGYHPGPYYPGARPGGFPPRRPY